jgi:hypothetical protein
MQLPGDEGGPVQDVRMFAGSLKGAAAHVVSVDNLTAGKICTAIASDSSQMCRHQPLQVQMLQKDAISYVHNMQRLAPLSECHWGGCKLHDDATMR